MGIDHDEEVKEAEILGGRWDGLSVQYNGASVEYKEERYIGLLSPDGRVFYLLEALVDSWYS